MHVPSIIRFIDVESYRPKLYSWGEQRLISLGIQVYAALKGHIVGLFNSVFAGILTSAYTDGLFVIVVGSTENGTKVNKSLPDFFLAVKL